MIRRLGGACAIVGTMIVTALCARAAPESTSPQSLPRNLSEWTIEYGISGGLAGIERRLTVSSDGAVTVADRYAAERVERRAPAELVSRIATFLANAHDEKASKRGPMPDAISRWLTATTGGREYPLELTNEIDTVLQGAMDVAVRETLAGAWSHLGWKLCTPAAQLGPEDADTPVETLAFADDGTFSVTWPGGGARTTGVPHGFIPDYRGRYDLTPSTGAIRMRIEGGLFVPADFAGQGTVRINGNQMTLRGVWLGTRKAKRKPDMCELSFTRT